MQITALLQVVNYLKGLAGDQSFLEMYKRLSDLVREAAKSKEDLTPEILRLKEEIKAMQLKNDPTDWGYASYSLFEKINSGRLFGKPAADYIEDLLDHGTRDYTMINTELNKTIKHLGKFSDNISKFTSLFELIFPLEELNNLDEIESRSSIYLYFEGQLNVQSISDLERYSRLWDGILDSFCSLRGEEKPAIEICNFSSGNIVLGIAADKIIRNAISAGVDGIISCLPNVLKIRKIQYEISHLPLKNNVNELLEEEAGFIISRTAAETARKLISADLVNEGSQNTEAILARSLKQILSFIEKGGKIEYKAETGSTDNEYIRRNLNESFRIAKEITSILHSLETEKLQACDRD
jgi:hypothetical protein